MPKNTIASVLSAIVLLGLVVSRAWGAEAKDLSPVLTTLLTEHRQIPGIVAAIVEDGRITAIGAAGVREVGNTAPMTTADQIHLGSCTKAMTAVLIGQLIEAGQLSFDTTMGTVFPELQAKMDLRMAKVTVAQLLQHVAGVPHDADWRALTRTGGQITTQRRLAVEQLFAAAPLYPPGSRFEYSNAGYVVLGAVLEKKTGKAWEDLVREKVFAPMGMSSAGFGAPGTPGKLDEPWGHVVMNGTVIPLQSDNPPVMGPAARVHCTISDWAKFIGLFLQPGRSKVLSPQTIAHLLTPGPVGDYNGGWVITHRNWADGDVLNHAGSNQMWFCVVWAAPRDGFAVLIATNIAGKDATKACDDLAGKLITMHTHK